MSVRFCDRCGGPLEGGVSSPPVTPGRHQEDAVPPATESAGAASHQTCQEARRFEPPRYCAHCGRRLVVQVRPDGWTARCAEHGPHHHD